jgi:hypothetical protein
VISALLEDQQGGVAVVLRDYNEAPYYPAPTVGAALVRLYARDSDKGVDTAFVIAEGKPGGEFSIPYAALTGRDLLFATVSFSSNGTPSVSDLEHADWESLPVSAGTIEVTEVMVDTAVLVGGDQVVGPREAAVAHVTAGTGSTVSGSAGGTYDATVQTIINDLVAQVNTLKTAVDANKSATNTALTRLEGHGLIDT